MNLAQDKAGKAYWDKNWSVKPPDLLDMEDTRTANEVNLRFHNYLSEMISPTRSAGKRFLEVGCARSVWLPYFAQKYGLKISGLDYSEDGCRQAKALLSMSSVEGEVICADLFAPPDEMLGAFDYVFSLGVVEHFTDTSACMAAMARFLRPGGMAITVIPNMRGTTGALQRLCDKAVFDIHVALTPAELQLAHDRAGLSTISCGYFISTNYYVVNSQHRRGSLYYPLLRLMHGAMGRLSMAVWWLERKFGNLPAVQAFSPYIICVARKVL